MEILKPGEKEKGLSGTYGPLVAELRVEYRLSVFFNLYLDYSLAVFFFLTSS